MLRSVLIPLSASVVLHAAVVVLLLVGLPSSSQTLQVRPLPDVVRAQLVVVEDQPPQQTQQQQPPAQAEAARQRAQEQERAERERAERERAERERAERQRAERERAERAKREQAERERREREQQERERAERERAERERRERARERILEQQREGMLGALEQEDAVMRAASDAELAQSYSGHIQTIISRNWSRPPSARSDMEVRLQLDLLPTGEVRDVRVIRSSGDAAFDQSALRAVHRSQPFSELAELPSRVFNQHFRRFEMTFRPEDL